jgi:hypothetical protein
VGYAVRMFVSLVMGVQIGDVAIVMLVLMVVGLVIMFRVIGRGNHM